MGWPWGLVQSNPIAEDLGPAALLRPGGNKRLFSKLYPAVVWQALESTASTDLPAARTAVSTRHDHKS
eukprot:224690-Alexandrium_andersonii.AAC.1